MAFHRGAINTANRGRWKNGLLIKTATAISQRDKPHFKAAASCHDIAPSVLCSFLPHLPKANVSLLQFKVRQEALNSPRVLPDTRGRRVPSCCCQGNISENDDDVCALVRSHREDGIGCLFVFFKTEALPQTGRIRQLLGYPALSPLIVFRRCSTAWRNAAAVLYHPLSAVRKPARSPSTDEAASPVQEPRTEPDGRRADEDRRGEREGGKKEKEIYECASISRCKS